MVTYKQLTKDKTQVCIPNRDYKMYWSDLCRLYNKFGGYRLRYVPGKLFWIIKAGLTEIENVLKCNQ